MDKMCGVYAICKFYGIVMEVVLVSLEKSEGCEMKQVWKGGEVEIEENLKER